MAGGGGVVHTHTSHMNAGPPCLLAWAPGSLKQPRLQAQEPTLQAGRQERAAEARPSCLTRAFQGLNMLGKGDPNFSTHQSHLANWRPPEDNQFGKTPPPTPSPASFW
jgi:hypothetical protein